jgi:hypothetical protein
MEEYDQKIPFPTEEDAAFYDYYYGDMANAEGGPKGPNPGVGPIAGDYDSEDGEPWYDNNDLANRIWDDDNSIEFS